MAGQRARYPACVNEGVMAYHLALGSGGAPPLIERARAGRRIGRQAHRMQCGVGLVKRVAVVLALAVLSLVTACAPAAPTPTLTPEPTATPVEVLATKPEHLVGIWFNPVCFGREPSGVHYQFEADGTRRAAYFLDYLHEGSEGTGVFWFEDGVYYEEDDTCDAVGSYRVYLRIEEGHPIALRFDEIDDSDGSCLLRRVCRRGVFVRVER